MFYSKLYTSNYSEQITFFSFLKDSKNISKEDLIFCHKPITIKEIMDSINHLKNNKSPGTDGLIAEFYKSFARQMTPFLLHVFNESISNGQLPSSMNQGLITLIPKPKKDLLFIDNWRPICLLNNDYKILPEIFAERIKTVLDSIIDQTQSGFMKNKHCQ